MMSAGKNYGNGILFLVVCIFLLLLWGFWAVGGYFDFKKNSKNYVSGMIDVIDQRMTSVFREINSFPGSASDDIVYLSELSSFKDAIDRRGDDKFIANGKRNIERDFLGFLKHSGAYYQLRYIDENGYEVVRVDFDGENYKVIPESELQDKSGRYYYKQAAKLDGGEIFISPLDLNIEEGRIENRGTDQDPVYVPVIRYAMAIIDGEGDKRGVIVTNIYGDYFLEDIRRSQREGEKMFLINQEGFYLAHPDRSKEFSFMFEGQTTFFRDYPEISQEAVLAFDTRRIETEDKIFSLRHIYPTTGSFGMFEGAKKSFGEKPEESYYWTLVSVSEKREVKIMTNNLRKTYIFSVIFFGAIVLVVIVMVFLLAFKRKNV